MTKTPKIVLNGGRDIPFCNLRRSKSNVRRIKNGVSIEELAEDIARRGLLNSLSVRPMVDDQGQETNLFEIPAGGRRYDALELLVKQKRLAKDAPIPCIVRTEGLAEEDSLAENVQRLGLHPLEQFYAFQTLAEKGLSEDDIAARFFVPANVVRQRLKMAAVSPVILDAYQAGTIALEIVMAFTVNPDVERQVAVFNQLATSRDLGTYRIKRALTESTVAADDKRARYLTLDAYVEAGGTVLRDLFDDANSGWLSDPALLDRLVLEKLNTAADDIRAEGWKWVEVSIDFAYLLTAGMDEIFPEVPTLSDEDRAQLQSAIDEYNGLLERQEQEDTDFPDAAAARLVELEDLIPALENPLPVFKAEDIAIAGVFLSLDRSGELRVEPGYVRPEDRHPEPAPEPDLDSPDDNINPSDAGDRGDDHETADQDQTALSQMAGTPQVTEEPEDMTVKPLPDSLHRELTAYRTLALRDALARNPEVAMTALLHKLCRDAFFPNSYLDGLEVRVSSANLAMVGNAELKDCAAAESIAARTTGWRGVMPKDVADLWSFISDLSYDSRTQLLAHLIAPGLNALYEPASKPNYNGPSAASVQHRLSDADRIAAALGLDLVASGWAPTIDNYLGRVPKARILLAVEEGCGADAAARIDHLKKPDMAAEAETLLKSAGWLPEPLRGPARPVTPPPPVEDAQGDRASDTPGDEHDIHGDGFAEAAE